MHDNMPTNHWNRRMKTLHKRIKNANISKENRELLREFKRDLEVQDYSKGRIYKLLNYLKIIGEHIDYNFEEAREEAFDRGREPFGEWKKRL